MLLSIRSIFITTTLLISTLSQASTTWVPINVGDVTTFIPFSPNEPFEAPKNVELTFNNSIPTLSWVDVEHASQYEIQGLNSSAQWVTVLTTNALSVEINEQFSNFSKIRIKSCDFNSCSNNSSSSWSQTINLEETSLGTESAPLAHVEPIPTSSYSDIIGTLPGKVLINNQGSAEYNIPIAMSAGIANHQPNFSLNYNSQNGNGPLGVGWAVNGTSTIERCRKTPEKDGYIRGIKFNDNDALCLNGQRLKLIDGSNFSNGAEYRTELDSLQKVIWHSNSSGNYFTVNHADGSELQYGASSNSIQEDTESGVAYKWMLSKKTDSSNNVITYNYTNSNNNEKYISSVNYSDNTIEFNYETRNDTSNRYYLGNYITNNQRLSNITVKNKNETTISFYKFSYTQSSFSDRSLLENIQQCASETGDCLPATEFEYSQPSAGFSNVTTELNLNNFIGGNKQIFGVTSLDYNADGYKDIALAYRDKSSGAGYIRLLKNTGNSYIAGAVFSAAAKQIGIDASDDKIYQARWLISDIDGNGTQDILYPESCANYTGICTWKLKYFDRNGAVSSTSSHQFSSQFSTYIFSDMNVDGRPDIYTGDGYYVNTSSSTTRFNNFIEIDTSHLNYELWQVISEEQGPPQNTGEKEVDGDFFDLSTGMPMPLDFNGDGQPDLASTYYIDWCNLRDLTYDCHSSTTRKRGESYLHPVILEQESNGEWSTTSLNDIDIDIDIPIFSDNNDYAQMPSNLRYGDINGDGYTDILANGRLHIVNGITALDNSSNIAVPDNDRSLYIAFDDFIDLNGDGRSDYIYKCSDDKCGQEGFYVRYSIGDNFQTHEELLFTSDVKFTKEHSVLWLDIDGDGLPGAVILDKENNTLLLREDANIANAPQDLITTVTNGLGAISNISYGLMTNANLYTLGSDSSSINWGNGSAVSDVINANYIVNNLSTDVSYLTNGNSQKANFNYKYQGLRVQSGGRGYLGFEKIYKTDTRTSLTTVTNYRQDFPYTGSIIKQETLLNNQIVESLENTFNTVSLNNGKNQYIYTETSKLKKFSFDNNNGSIGTRHAISTVETNNTYQAYSEGIITLNGSYSLLTNKTVTTTDHSQNNDNYTQVSTFNYASNNNNSSYDNEEDWWIGKVKSKTLVLSRTGSASVTQKTAYEYNTVNGKLSAEIIDPNNNADSYLKTAYTYNNVGNQTTITQCSIHYASTCATQTSSNTKRVGNEIFRRTTLSYDNENRYLIQKRNLAFIEQKYQAFNALGQPTKIIDVDGNITDIRYDNFGKEFFRRTAAIGTFTYNNIYSCSGTAVCPSNAVYYTTITSADNVTEQQYFDALGNIVKSSKNSFTETLINILFKYDNFARQTYTSVAHFADTPTNNITWIQTHYDIFGRAIQSVNASGSITNIHYNNNVVWQDISSNHNGYNLTRDRYEHINALGESVAVKDGLNNTIYYTYDAIGKLDLVTAVDGTQIDTNHNAYGRKISLNDPDKGYWQYKYNALGEQIQTTAPDGVYTNQHFDNVGRVYTSISKNSNATTIDTVNFNYTAHQLQTEQLGNTSKSYQYDPQGRLSSLTHTIDGTNYTERTTYDQFGRLFQQFDADTTNGILNNRGIRYHYKNGYVSKQQEARGGTEGVYYYQVDAIDALGNVTDYRKGKNEITVSKGFDKATGQLMSIDSSMGMIQSLEYKFDGLGNLRTRQDNINEFMGTTELQVETFDYDVLNRLTNVTQNGYTSLSVNYTTAGNISSKSDVLSGSTYQYNQKASQCNNISGAVVAGAHAVSKISNRQYCYDVRGNQTHQFDSAQQTRKVVYSHFDKPVHIESNQGTTDFSYDMSRNRYKRVDQLNNAQGIKETTTTYYLGNLEVIHLPNGIVEYKRYLGDGALETIRNNHQNELIYLFKDHIGSTDVVTDHNGVIKERLSFDAFGKRRHTAAWEPFESSFNFNDLLPVLNITPRGFTGHEHVDHANIIHMNGRIYDPSLGRFLQADPVVQEINNSQNFNRYSYVLNNPLSYTDPTGYEFEKDSFSDFMDLWSINANQTNKNQQKSNKKFQGKKSSGVLEASTNDNASKDSGTSGDGEANFKINRLNDQIDAIEATKAKESEYSITLVAHQDESIEFKGVEIPDVIGHAFVIMRGPNGEFAKGFWPSDGASFDDFISDTPLGGALSDEGDYHSRFKSWQVTGKDPKGGQFAFRSFALTKAQYQSGVSAISNWGSNPYMGQSRMCGSFATHVLRATGQSYGNSKTPYYLFYDMGGSFDKN